MIRELESDNLIFKFQSTGEYLDKSLANNTLFFSSIKEFNDPFESMFNIHQWETSKVGIEYFYQRVYPDTLLQEIPKERHAKIIHEKLTSPAIDIAIMIDLKESIHTIIRELCGVVCFSKDYKELLMWSHYANSGKGICLVYDKPSLFNIDENGYPKIEDVSYKDELPSIPVKLSDQTVHFNLPKLITTKRKNWDYENEVRAYINLGKITHNIRLSSTLLNEDNKEPRNLKYNPQALKGIIFGHDCEPEVRKQIKTIVQKNREIKFEDVRWYEAGVNRDSGQYIFRQEK